MSFDQLVLPEVARLEGLDYVYLQYGINEQNFRICRANTGAETLIIYNSLNY